MSRILHMIAGGDEHVEAVLRAVATVQRLDCRAAIKMRASVNQDETVPMLG